MATIAPRFSAHGPHITRSSEPPRGVAKTARTAGRDCMRFNATLDG